MANRLISQLDAADPLVGDELVPIFQSGETRRTTIGAMSGAVTGLQQTVLPAGATNNLALDTNVGFLDLDPTSGAANVTGIEAGFNGQILVVTNVNAANPVTLNTLNGGSLAANRMRLPADMTLLQYSNITLRYSTDLSLWIPL